MARIEEAVYALLSADATVTGYVSTRIYPYYLPQQCTYPAIVFGRTDTMRETAMGRDIGYATARMQIAIWSTNLSSGSACADAVRDSLHWYCGTIGGVNIHETYIDAEDIFYEDTLEAYQIPLDFMISYSE